MKSAVILTTTILAWFFVPGPLTGAEAAWKMVFIEESGLEFYIDTDSLIHVEDAVVRVWEKTATRMPGDKPSLFLVDVDCRYQVFRTLQSIYGEGAAARNNTTREWQPLEKIGNLETRDRLFEAVCGTPER